MRRPGPLRDIPPPLELDCLRILWTLQEANVKGVRDALASRRDLAYTTVMTVLERLVRKGGVTRRKVGRSFLYAPALSRETLRRVAVKELLDCFFDGSRDDLLAYLHVAESGAEASSVEPEAEPEPDVEVEERLDTALL